MEQTSKLLSVATSKNGQVKVTVFDAELLDFIEDYLIEECDIEYQYLSKDEESQNVFVMHFSKRYKLNVIKGFLAKLDPKELEKIYSLNNDSNI